MKRLNTSGLTAATVLIVALVGGAAGGAIAMGGAHQTPTAPATVQLHPAAAEVDATPSESPTPAAAVPSDTGTVTTPQNAPATAPQPAADTTQADRAKAEADRAKAEADRATTAADKATAPDPAPAPAVVRPSPAAPKPECDGSETRSTPSGYDKDGHPHDQVDYTCRGGRWVETGRIAPEPRPVVHPDPAGALIPKSSSTADSDGPVTQSNPKG